MGVYSLGGRWWLSRRSRRKASDVPHGLAQQAGRTIDDRVEHCGSLPRRKRIVVPLESPPRLILLLWPLVKPGLMRRLAEGQDWDYREESGENVRSVNRVVISLAPSLLNVSCL